MKLCSKSEEHFKKHYAEHVGKPFFERLVKYAASGPVLAMVWEGDNVIQTGRKIIGATKALDRNQGTVRFNLSVSTENTVIHGSDSKESADFEINLWFKSEELTNYGDHSGKLHMP